ncbi:MAG: hypothetical protein M3Y84_05835, partial [Acidobacteriota bacterium]|nr:hypothetical protein [Acidobacteriota bacterium]
LAVLLELFFDELFPLWAAIAIEETKSSDKIVEIIFFMGSFFCMAPLCAGLIEVEFCECVGIVLSLPIIQSLTRRSTESHNKQAILHSIRVHETKHVRYCLL